MRKPFHTSLELVSKPLSIGQEVPEEPLWKRLSGNLRDAMFAKKLPPLELTSQPIAVADPMAVKRDPLSSTISFVLHAAVFALIVWFTLQARKQIIAPQRVEITPIKMKLYMPVAVPAPKPMGGGGGGGLHQVIEVNKGHVPPVVKMQIAPPQLLVIDHPKLAAPPAVVVPPQVKLPNNNMPNLGATQSPQIELASQGRGRGSGFGAGLGGGLGSGRGAGVGPGSTGGYGGGIMTVGGGVAAPRVIHSVEPQFTDQARQSKYQGVVAIQLIVDAQGNPEDIHVTRHLGMGLDEKAVEAIRQYKFQPAMFQGHPVPVQIVVEINFHLY